MIELHETINALLAETVGVELIEEYILCNYCRSGRAQYRDRIMDVELLILLAERWQDEIRRHAAEESSCAVSIAPLESIILPNAITTLAILTPSHTIIVYTTSIASPPNY